MAAAPLLHSVHTAKTLTNVDVCSKLQTLDSAGIKSQGEFFLDLVRNVSNLTPKYTQTSFDLLNSLESSKLHNCS